MLMENNENRCVYARDVKTTSVAAEQFNPTDANHYGDLDLRYVQAFHRYTRDGLHVDAWNSSTVTPYCRVLYATAQAARAKLEGAADDSTFVSAEDSSAEDPGTDDASARTSAGELLVLDESEPDIEAGSMSCDENFCKIPSEVSTDSPDLTQFCNEYPEDPTCGLLGVEPASEAEIEDVEP